MSALLYLVTHKLKNRVREIFHRPSELVLLLIGAALNTILFFTVSIPMAERRQAQKPGFEQYKSVTRLILPFPRLSQIQSSDPPRQTDAKPAETKMPETTAPAEETPETKMPEETVPEGKVPEESFPEAFDSETDPREQ